jgi:hypothetical protein
LIVRARLASLLLLPAMAGCATLQELAALHQVAFAFDRVSEVRLAGIALDRVDGWSQLTTIDAARLVAAVASGNVPLDLVVHVRAENPSDNHVTARLVGLDWTFFVEDRKTVAGHVAGGLSLPPGQPVDVPVPVALNLSDYFHDGARDLFELALGIAGRGNTRSIRLEATPTIETSLGPIRYPEPIVIERAATP